MGQYHRPVNIDKKQYIVPHKFTDGYKLLEWGQSLTSQALAVLLACSNNRGGGDLYSDDPIIGSWAGDRVAVVGDYWEQDEADSKGIPTWEDMDNEYEDISDQILKALCQDSWLRGELIEAVIRYDWGRDWSDFFPPEEVEKVRKRLEEEKE